MPADSGLFREDSRYSFTWAMSVVEKLCSKYTRATEIEKAVFSLSNKELAAFLARNDPFWAYFRDQVHEMDKRCKEIGSFNVNICSRRRGTLDRISTVSSPELRRRVVHRLTMLGTRTTLEEQANKGAAEALGTPKVEAAFLLSSHLVMEDPLQLLLFSEVT